MGHSRTISECQLCACIGGTWPCPLGAFGMTFGIREETEARQMREVLSDLLGYMGK